jgi:hypothetical protein
MSECCHSENNSLYEQKQYVTPPRSCHVPDLSELATVPSWRTFTREWRTEAAVAMKMSVMEFPDKLVWWLPDVAPTGARWSPQKPCVRRRQTKFGKLCGYRFNIVVFISRWSADPYRFYSILRQATCLCCFLTATNTLVL